MSIADDIQKARDAGHSDTDILSALKQSSPQYAKDIDSALSARHSPKDVLAATAQFDTAASPEVNRSTFDKVTAPFRHGAAQEAKGLGSTISTVGGDGVVSKSLQAAGDIAEPTNYTPAHVTINPKTWGDIPKAVAESAPGLVTDVAAGAAGAATGGAIGSAVPGVGTTAGALIGGGVGAVASYGARNFGDDAKAAAVARTGKPDAVPNGGDYARAMAMSAIGGIASRVGYKGAIGSPVKAANGSVVSQVVPQVAKGAAIDAASGAASTAAHQGIIDQKFDPSEIGGAAITGGVTGAALRTGQSIKDFKAASQFKGLTPEEATPVANMLREVHGDTYQGTAKEDFAAVKKVHDDLNVRAKTLASDGNVTGHIAAIQEANQSSPVKETLGRVRQDIAEARTPSAEDIKTLRDALGTFPHGSDLVDTLQHQSVLNKIKALGNFDEASGKFSGGMASTPIAQSILSPFGKIGGKIDAGAAVYGVLGATIPGMSAMHALASPATAAMLPAAQAVIYGGMRGVDTALGNRSPVSQFTGRFAGEAPAAASRGPSFNEVLAQSQAATKAAQVAQKASQSQAKAVDPLVRVKRQMDMMKASAKVEEQRQSNMLGEVARNAKLRESSESASSSDATTALRVAKLKAELAVKAGRDTSKETADVAKAQKASEVADTKAKTEALRVERATQAAEAKRQSDVLAAAGRQARLMKNSESASSTSADLPIRVAKLKAEYAAKAEREAQKAAKASGKPASGKVQSNGTPTVPAGSVDALRTPQVRAAPKEAEAVTKRPASFKIIHEDGTRTQVVSDVTHSKNAVTDGVLTKADARRDIVSSLPSVPKDVAKVIREGTFNTKTETAARKHVEEAISHLPKVLKKSIRNHLENHVDPSTGHTFYNTWNN